MCKIYATRKSSTTVYLELDDEERDYWGVKKLSIPQFEYAKQFKNMDFISAVSKETTVKRDEDDALIAVDFIDPNITYSARDYLL